MSGFAAGKKNEERSETLRPLLHQALGTQHMCCHLALLELVQSKPSLSAQACTGQDQAELDGSTCGVCPVPERRCFFRGKSSSRDPRGANLSSSAALAFKAWRITVTLPLQRRRGRWTFDEITTAASAIMEETFELSPGQNKQLSGQ